MGTLWGQTNTLQQNIGAMKDLDDLVWSEDQIEMTKKIQKHGLRYLLKIKF